MSPYSGSKKVLNCCSWNVKAGLIKREIEIRNLLQKHEINILFLNETDTFNIKKESDYKIEGFTTVLQKRESENEKLRLICLESENLANDMKVRNDLMSTSTKAKTPFKLGKHTKNIDKQL